MAKFKPSMLMLALASAGFTNVTMANTTSETDSKAKAGVEIIEVKGFRASVARSINTKRFSPEVVESISAEDIGKLPDVSIAESISRLPGLTSQRFEGRSNKVSLRGFSENETAVTLNGREQVSIGDNRGVELDLYPSEIMSGVTVYKTPSARLEAEGIAGVIDMQTIRPLSVDDRVIQLNMQYEQSGHDKLNPDGDDAGLKGTFSFVDKFADDTLGVAFALTSMASPNQEKRWQTWGYPEFETQSGEQYSILGGAKPFVRSSTLNRDSVMLVLESAPSDKLSMSFDALYVDYKDEKILRGIETPFFWGQGTIRGENATVDAQSGFITSALTEGQRVVVRNDYEEIDAELNAFGFNARYQLTDTLSVEFDASHSSVDRKVWSLESYSGTGRGDERGEADNIGYAFAGGNTGAVFTHELDYSDFSLIKIGGPLSWGHSDALNEKYGVVGTDFENQLQDGFLNVPEIEDTLNSIRLSAQQLIDHDIVSDIRFGVAYKEREKSKLSEGYFLTLSQFNYPDNTDLLEVPEEYRLGSANLDFIGMGDMIAYDSRGMVNDGYFNLLAESLSDTSHATKSWTVEEEVVSAFFQVGLNTEIVGFPLTGNAGLRYIDTTQSSTGSAFSSVDGKVVTTPTYQSHSYSHLLPSLNLSLAIDESQTVRFGFAKTLSRSRLDDMHASVKASYNYDREDENGNNWLVEGGNTKLEPREAVGFDLTYENYFSPEGYFAASLFQKDLNEWTFDGIYQVSMEGVADPQTGEIPENPNATGKGKVNGGEGDLWGYEFAITYPLNLIHDSLEGFGVIFSHTAIESDIQDPDGNDFKLPGLSERTQNVTVYYEHSGVQFRTSMRKRSDFKGDVYGKGFTTEQLNILGETIWDLQVGYDFSESNIEQLEGLTVNFQVQNLTEEPFTALSGDNKLQVRDYQDYGRNFLLGVSYKF